MKIVINKKTFFLVSILLSGYFCKSQVTDFPIEIIKPSNQFGISLNPFHLVNDEESNGRIGYLFTSFNKNEFLTKVEKYVDDTIRDCLNYYGLLGNNSTKTCHCVLPYPDYYKELNQITPKIYWNDSITMTNEKIVLNIVYVLWGNLYREIPQGLAPTKHQNTPGKALIQISGSLELSINKDAVKQSLYIEILGNASGKIVNTDCNYLYSPYSASHVKPRMHIDKKIYIKFPVELKDLQEEIDHGNINCDDKYYYIYFTLTSK